MLRLRGFRGGMAGDESGSRSRPDGWRRVARRRGAPGRAAGVAARLRRRAIRLSAALIPDARSRRSRWRTR